MNQAAQEKKPPNIDIYKAWCKACGICVAFCPTGTLARDEAGYWRPDGHGYPAKRVGLCERKRHIRSTRSHFVAR